jgi:dihydroxyacid dehydratase/phosphogluconate dehydratase
MLHRGRLVHAKERAMEAKCTPREFTPISVSDVILMGHEGMKCSLISRERSEHTVVLYYSYYQIRWVFHDA